MPPSPTAARAAAARTRAAEPPAPVTEWSRPAPIYEYQLAGTTNALLHVERKVRDRPGLVRSVGAWLEEYELELEECVYSPCPGGVADIEIVAGGRRADVLRALKVISGPKSIFDLSDPSLHVPEKRHTARCTIYLPDGVLDQSLLIPVGEAAAKPDLAEYPGLPYANISHLVVERSPYALGVPGYAVDVFLTADSREVLDAVIGKLSRICEPFGCMGSWILRVWPCACPSCSTAPAA